MYKRLTPEHGWKNACYDTWEICGLDSVCKRDCREPIPCKIPQMLYRLAEFEETELSPEEITDKIGGLENKISDLKATLEIYREFDGCRLHQLIEADMDGRLVVLPCKVGDAVYHDSGVFGVLKYFVDGFASYDKDVIFQAAASSVGVDDVGECLDEIEFTSDDMGKTVFLTREEAEKALGGSEDGK